MTRFPTSLPVALGLFAFVALCSLTISASAQVPSGPKDWPQWRGPNRDGINDETGLLKEWPEGGPKVLWHVDSVGVGYSSLAIKDGRIFTQGDLDGVEHIICLSVEDGKTLWAVQPEPVARELAEKIESEFKRMDQNSNGKIDEAEALARLGWKFNDFDKPAGSNVDAKTLAGERAKRLFKALDKNGDAKLSYDEAGNLFRDYFARIDAKDEEADAAALIKTRTNALMARLDKDNDGKISRDESRRSELDRAFGRADQRDPATSKGDNFVTSGELAQYFEKFEPGRDGLLSLAELAQYYLTNRPGSDGILTAEDLRGYYGGYRNGQGDGPRGTPTVDGNRVYAEGGNGDVTCLDAEGGKTIWHVNLREDFGGGRPGWGYCESPLIIENMVILTPGGKNGTLVALDKLTGQLIWRSSGINEGAHYSSAVLADIGGIPEVVQFARGSVFGVTLDEGKLMWKYSAANNGTANVATPIVENGYVFASSAYGTGGGLAKISPDGDGQMAEEVYFEKKMANHHGGIVKVGDYMYGFGSGGLLCMNYLTGKIAWQARSVRKGSLVVADGMLYLLGERHEVALAEANPKAYIEHGRFKIEPHGRPSWAHPVVIDGRFYIRDQESLTAYDVRAR